MALVQARPSLTRKAALDGARRTYRGLVERVLELPNVDREYLQRLAAFWDDRLGALAWGYSPDVTLPDHVELQFAALEQGAMRPNMDDDLLVELIDAYPDAIAEMFPPSQATFWALEGGDGSTPSETVDLFGTRVA